MSLQISHTPGPWEAVWDHPDVDTICHVRPVGRDVSWREIATLYTTPRGSEKEANARLMAAAPDLLAALKAVISSSRECGDFESDVLAFNEARAAIAKAELPTVAPGAAVESDFMKGCA